VRMESWRESAPSASCCGRSNAQASSIRSACHAGHNLQCFEKTVEASHSKLTPLA
jgi:hypothetical protein